MTPHFNQEPSEHTQEPLSETAEKVLVTSGLEPTPENVLIVTQVAETITEDGLREAVHVAEELTGSKTPPVELIRTAGRIVISRGEAEREALREIVIIHTSRQSNSYLKALRRKRELAHKIELEVAMRRNEPQDDVTTITES